MSRSTQKIAIVIIIILVLTNIGMLAGMWFRPIPNRLGFMAHKTRLGEFLRQELNLSKAQMDEFRHIGENHQKKMQHFHQETAMLKELMYNLLKEGRSDDEIAYIADKIGILHSRREQQTYHHFYELRELCNKEQKEKFDDLIKEVIRITSPTPPMAHQRNE